MQHSSNVLSRTHQQRAHRLEESARVHRLLERPDRRSLRSTVAHWFVAVARRIDSNVVTA